jgi:signal transduction histidine kinase
MEEHKERRRIKRLATARAAGGARVGLSLRQKVAWTLAAVVLYCTAIAAGISLERGYLFNSLAEIEELHKLEQYQITLNMTVSRTILDIDNNYWERLDRASTDLARQTESVVSGLKALQPIYPGLSLDIAALTKNVTQLKETPSNELIADTRAHFYQLVPTLDSITTDIASHKQRLIDNYRQSFVRLSYAWLGFGVFGVVLLGGLMVRFFRRLGADILQVRQRAVDIVDGYRGAPLPVTRHDELGALMEAINDMQHGLREHESQLELSRQQQFHKDKMAAVGSLAAAVAHEINNPLSAIIGVAEAIERETHTHKCQVIGAPCKPELILEHARRVMAITRQISEFSVPRSPNPALLDLNGLLRNTCNFVSYDRRFRMLELELDLDSDIPAVFGVADHLMQVVMNMLINACDALQGRHDPPPKIRVRSLVKDGNVAFEVSDNGIGIAPENLDRVFDEYFTTKGSGSGIGLGLALCRQLIHDAGGEISIASTQGVGTTVTVTLPIPPDISQ